MAGRFVPDPAVFVGGVGGRRCSCGAGSCGVGSGGGGSGSSAHDDGTDANGMESGKMGLFDRCGKWKSYMSLSSGGGGQ